MSRLIENYNIVNCYVDTTFVSVGTGAIMVSSFSSDDDNIQEKYLENSMRVTVNDGYKFDLEVEDEVGSNLLTNPTFKGGQNGWAVQRGNAEFKDDMLFTSGSPTEVYRTNVLSGVDSFTASIWVKGSGEFQARAGGLPVSEYITFNHDTFQQISSTFEGIGSGNLILMIYGDNIEVEKVKLEKGNKATDWYPLDDYYFDMQFQPLDDNLRQFQLNTTLPFTRVTLADFEPVTDISTYDWIKDYVGYQLYMSIEPDNSMFYTYTVGNTTHLILLYGGIRDNDLLFFTFAKKQSSNNTVSFSMNGDEWVSVSTFSTEMLDMETGETVELSFLNNLNFVATVSDDPIEDVSKYLFDSYYVKNADLSRIKNTSGLTSELLINTYSYPLNFSDDTLIDVTFTVAGITQNIPAKKFLKNINDIEIFKFQIPDVPDVREVKLRIPFNNDVTISYEDVRGKTIVGRFSYEVLTNTTTLIINDGFTDIYNTMVGVGVTVPYRPTGEYKGGSDPTTRLAKTDPKLFIKGVGKTISGNFIQGFIRSPISNILSSERDTLNTLLKEGVYFND